MFSLSLRGQRLILSPRLLVLSAIILSPHLAMAASFEGSLQSLVNSVLSRILPLIALYYVGEAAVYYIQNKPDAKDRISRVAVGTVALLGVNGVWSWLQSQVR